jgi:Sel1 repeat
MLLILAASAACETPRVDTTSVEAPSPSPYAVARPESGVGRMSRECKAGKKVSCYLLARAYEKGEAPVTAVGEIVVRDSGRAAYYHEKACALGELWSCYSVAGRYLKGDGVEQNSAHAARLYFTTCNSGEVLDDATKFSCAALGDLYVKGQGVPFNFKTGLGLLKRACAMGAERGCKLHDIYGGTGMVSEATAPEGALGFTFGWSADETKAACLRGQGKWSAEPPDAVGERYFCDIRLDALDHDATAQLVFVKGRLAALSAAYDLDKQSGPKEFLRVGDLLNHLYGLPSNRVFDVLDGCGAKSLGECIQGKQAEFLMTWWFKDGHAISSTLNSTSNKPLFLMIEYESRASLSALGNPGL